MEINPTGPGGPLPPLSGDEKTVRKAARAVRPEAATVPDAGQAFQGVTAEFHKADLQDPAKVDQMLQRCAGELVQSSLNRVDGKISPAGAAQLTESLQNDPLVRGKLLNYLERVLT